MSSPLVGRGNRVDSVGQVTELQLELERSSGGLSWLGDRASVEQSCRGRQRKDPEGRRLNPAVFISFLRAFGLHDPPTNLSPFRGPPQVA